MIVRWRVGALLSVLGALGVWTALSACSSSSSEDYAPPRSDPATDPGCKVISETAPKTAGQALSVVHEADAVDADADADAGAAPEDAGPLDDSGGTDGGAIDAEVPAAVTITPEDVRTVACRQGTTLDVAAGPSGGLFVAGAAIRAQVITFADGAPSTRLVEYLQRSGASARIATLPDGQPYLVASPTEQADIVTEEGTSGPRPFAKAGGVGTVGRAATNAAGSILVAVQDGALLRTASGETKKVSVPERTGSLATYRSLIGLGNDDAPFRVMAGGPALVQTGERIVRIDAITSVYEAAFTTLAADATLPALALVHGEPSRQVTELDVAIPNSASDAYARVVVVPRATPCAPEPQCNNTCTEENVEVSPKEIAMAHDGERAFLAFVRRSVTRERRYQNKNGSGIICDLFGCDPSCTSDSSSTSKKADLVIATVDGASGKVTEVFAQPLEVSNGSSEPAIISSSPSAELSAHARDGYLHVAFTGTYQGAFPAVSVFRFRIGR